MFREIRSTVVEVDQIGETALALLAEADGGTVLACVSQAVYLQTRAGELFWITSPLAPLHRRGICIQDPLPALEPGMAYHLESGRLWVEPGFGLDYGSAVRWQAPRISPDSAIPLRELQKLFASLGGHLLAWPKMGYTSQLLPMILAGSAEAGDLHGLDRLEFSDLIVSDIWDMVMAVRAHDPKNMEERFLKLVGLGPGLTPSGDDFLGGVFFGLFYIHQLYPQIYPWIDWNCRDCIQRGKASTNLISYTFMNDLASGEAIEPLHLLMNALFTGAPLEECLIQASRVVNFGHSTGWDLLTGFLAGLSVINLG